MVLSVGTVVAGYTIEAVLGWGGMGTVYRATHPSLPRSDALKILSEELSREEEIRHRFLREADLAATLNHPNIVAIYDRGETDDGRLWIAMQYIAGTDADREVRRGRMTPDRAVQIIGDVATALDYAHRRLVLHRDVKPANFLIDIDDDRVFLADFGIARALDDAAELTRTGTVMASISYAAPESLKAVPVDYRADIYSLGCALYHLLAGKTPYFRSQVGGMAGLISAHLFEPPPQVTEVATGLPPAMDAVIAKAMAKAPEERYQSAQELAAAAAQAVRGDTPSASVTQPWPTSDPAAQVSAPVTGEDRPSDHANGPNGIRPAPVLPSIVASPPASPSLFAHPVQPFAQPPTDNGRRPGGRRLLIAAAVAMVVVTVAAVIGFVLMRDPKGVPYVPQTFDHVHGDTQLTAAPTAVAALGPGDADAVLSLGVQPVAMTAPSGKLPNFERSSVTGNPTVLGSIDTAAVAKANPDLIIATGDIDDDTYNKLAAIATTITRPVDNFTEGWSWQIQLTWIGRILGRQPRVDELIDATIARQNDVRNQNPAFGGKSIEALTVTDAGVARVLAPSFAADYLQSLGFLYNPDAIRNAADTGATRPITDLTQLSRIETDYLILIRSDAAADNGGLGGLPQQFATYAGRILAVDDTNTVAAFADPGGYLAIKHLDDNVAPAIAAS